MSSTPHGTRHRTSAVTRWLTGYGISGLSVESGIPKPTRILGLKGLLVRVTLERSANTTAPLELRNMRSSSMPEIRVVPAVGMDVQDSVVMMRLDHFAPFLEAYTEKYAHRVYGERDV